MDSLYELSDILAEIESIIEDEHYSALLKFNSSARVLPIVNKLSHHLQTEWMNHAAEFKKARHVP